MRALLELVRSGDELARDRLFGLVQGELHGLAKQQMAHQPPSHTLQPTALVNEAYLKLCDGDLGSLHDEEHFKRLAARAMRQILVDHARRKKTAKRGGGAERVELESLCNEYERRSGGLIALDAALEALAEREPELVKLVELRFFAGSSMEEVAQLLGISVRQANRRWNEAKERLKRELES